MAMTYREGDAFRASRAKTAHKRYWRDPEKARQRLRDYRRARNCCDGCRQPFDRRRREHVELGPMLHDFVLRQIAKERALLCWGCMLRRAVQRLGRVLTSADLRPCCWNLWRQPESWFDLFVEIEGTPPRNLDEWRGVGDPGEFVPLNFPRT